VPDSVLQSEAFQKAVLKSERGRLVGLLWVLGLLFAFVVVRGLISGDESQLRLLPVNALMFMVFIAFEGAMLVQVRRAIASATALPGWLWPLGAFVEILLPTAAILILTESDFLGPYRALVAPALTAYFVFIGLSTLRLDPVLSRWTGVFAGGGYGAMVLYTFTYHPDEVSSALPIGLYVTHGLFLLFGGWIAGAVAAQIRDHVGAALVEARQTERMERDIEVARTIQQGLLPSEPPKVEGFDVAGWNQPADETGGDYFDWQPLADGRVAVMLGDVTGHGIGPALVTAACRAYGRASMLAGGDLGSVIDRDDQRAALRRSSPREVGYLRHGPRRPGASAGAVAVGGAWPTVALHRGGRPSPKLQRPRCAARSHGRHVLRPGPADRPGRRGRAGTGH